MTVQAFEKYKVYTLTAKNNFSCKYHVNDELDALKAYDKLVEKKAPRCFAELKIVNNGLLATNRMRSEDFPE